MKPRWRDCAIIRHSAAANGRRTGNPMAIDIENDELAFFPLLYWAVSPRQQITVGKSAA